MTLSKYKRQLQQPPRARTVTFLQRGHEVLLGLKKRGLGSGYYLGIGGKVEEEKDRRSAEQSLLNVIENAAVREINEEIGVVVKSEDLVLSGVFHFYFPHIADGSWNQQVWVFSTSVWQGEPKCMVDEQGRIEIEPEWIIQEQLPFERMWDDAQYWMQTVLAGQKIDGEFLYDEQLKVTDYNLYPVKLRQK